MTSMRIALFGESEKGNFNTAYFCDTLDQLADMLGNPPEESRGLFFAIRALLFNHSLIYFRVEEEGFSQDDYYRGIDLLTKQELLTATAAICMPGVGNRDIVGTAMDLCRTHGNLLITSESDLYDYLTGVAL